MSRLSDVQSACIMRAYDRTLGGEEIVSADREVTLTALASRGLVRAIRSPQWDGGPWTAYLTDAGRAVRAAGGGA